MTKFEEAAIAACKAFLAAYAVPSTQKDNVTPLKPKAPRNQPGEIPTCPIHDRVMKEGKFGYFCSAKEDDPTLSNKNGYCNYKAN